MNLLHFVYIMDAEASAGFQGESVQALAHPRVAAVAWPFAHHKPQEVP